MSEISWDWPEITCVLMWKLAPQGVTLTRRDMAALPQDRVMVTDRQPNALKLSFVSLQRAMAIRDVLAPTQKPAGVSALEGRWEKIGVVLLWKLCKGGITLTEWDKAQVPHDKQILARGYRDGVEFRFMPNSEAAKLTKWDRDNDKRLIRESVARALQ
jgi:hypothetical protein